MQKQKGLILVFLTVCALLAACSNHKTFNQSGKAGENTVTPTITVNVSDGDFWNQLSSRQNYFSLWVMPFEDNPLAYFDLDLEKSGNENPEDADVKVVLGGGSIITGTLDILNASKSYIADENMGIRDCFENLDKFTEGTKPLELGRTFCVQTNQNKMAMIQYVGGHPAGNNDSNIMSIFSYTIWDLSIDEIQEQRKQE